MLAYASGSCYAQSEKPRQKPERQRANNQQQQAKGGGSKVRGGFLTDVPEHPFDIILGRPTAMSVTASILAYQDTEGYIEYGLQSGQYPHRTETLVFTQGEPVELLITDLQPDTRYYYRFRSREADGQEFEMSEEYSFHTQRPASSTFTFGVQADPHLDRNTDPRVYTQTLLNVRGSQPDFYIDLGDTFMTGKYRDNYQDALKQYLAHRYYFGLVDTSAPVFLTLGNHDGESGQQLNGKADNRTIWAANTRKTYFPNPFPDSFYTGNSTEEKHVGLPENYYAWEWGMPYLSCSIRTGRRPARAKLPGTGHWAHNNIIGSHKRLNRARRHLNLYSFIIC
jgi:hypothetical protein